MRTKLQFEGPVFAALCAALVFASALAAQTYSDPEGRFRVQVPAGWTTTPLNNDAVSFLRGSSYVTVMVYSSQSDPAALIVSVAGQIGRQWRGLAEVDRREATLAGQRGASATYSGTNPKGIEAYMQLIGAAAGSHTFVLMLSAPKTDFASLKSSFDQMQRSFVVGGAAGGTAPRPALGGASANRPNAVDRPPAGAQAISAVRLHLTNSPGGNFALALPQGWSVTASPGGDSVSMTPVGSRQPSVYMAIVSVSDLRYQARLAACLKGGFNPLGNPLTRCVIPSVETQLSDSSRQWTPEEGFQLFLQRLQHSNRAGQFGAPVLTSISSSQAYYRVSGTGPNGPVENWGIVSMDYLSNPTLGPGKVTSLALIAGCTAPSGQADSFGRTCAGMVQSFRPDPNWFGRLAAGIENIYEQEAQTLIRMGQNIVQGFQARERMITSFGQSTQQLQLQTFQAIQSRNYLTGQGWIATFAGNTLIPDPAHPGDFLTAPYGYPSYGIDDRGLVPTIIYGNDVKPGTSVGTATVQRTLP